MCRQTTALRFCCVAILQAGCSARPPAPAVCDLPFARPFAVAFAPHGNQVAVGGSDEKAPEGDAVVLVDAFTGERVAALRHVAGARPDSSFVNDLAYSPDGTLIAVAAENGLRLWNPTTGDDVSLLEDGYDDAYAAVSSVAFSPDGKLLGPAHQLLSNSHSSHHAPP